jgi:hypothetical protein
LLEERDYSKKREKRIIQVLGAQPFSLELPDPEEEAFRMKAYAALEKTVIERQEKLLREEWEKLFPEEEKVETNQPTQEEMEQRYQELLSQVEDEVEAHRIEEERRIAEEKRKAEEERLRREAEERRKKEAEQRRRERERLERELFEKRLLGYWYYTYGCLTVKIIIDSKKTASCMYTCTVCGGSRIQYDVEFDGSNIKLSALFRTGSHCTYSQYPQMDRFSGVINTNGTIMTGYLSGGYSIEFHKC